MKNKITFIPFVLCFSLSLPLALAQTDKATGTVTNDTTMARLHISNCVLGGPNVDVYVNGEIAVNGGVAQDDHDFYGVTGYLYLSPGNYSVAVVPTGKAIEEALIGPLDVLVEAGHRYTVVVLGQADEASHTPLIIDETAAYQAIGKTPADNAHISINNVKGISSFSFGLGGVLTDKDIPYGGYKAAIWPLGTAHNVTIQGTGTSDPIDIKEDGIWLLGAGMDFLDCFGGTASNWDTSEGAYTSDLSTLDFLAAVSAVDSQPNDGGFTFAFNTFLTAVKTAGLTDLFISETPYMLFAPTDEAFAALPKGQLDALLIDPTALAKLVKNHLVAGYYPPYSLGLTGYDRTVTNLLGEAFVLTGTHVLEVNGVSVLSGGNSYAMAGNGNRVFLINKVLLPK